MRRGLCGGGDVDDPDESLGEAAAGWPHLGQFALQKRYMCKITSV